MRNINLLSSLFFSALVSAIPLQQRDYQTIKKVAVTTQVVFKTIWVDEAGQTPIPQVNEEAMSLHPGQFGYKSDAAPWSSSSIPIATPTPPPYVPTTPPVQPTPIPQTTQQAPAPPASQYSAPPPPPPYSAPPQPPASSSSAYTPQPTSGGSPGGGAAGSIGEKHSNVRLSAITLYSEGLIVPDKTYSSCQKPGAPNGNPEHDAWKMDDINGAALVALDANVPNWASYCGKKIKITNGQTGKSTTAMIVDKCSGCGSDSGAPYSLDLLKAPWDVVGDANSRQPVDAKLGSSWEIIE